MWAIFFESFSKFVVPRLLLTWITFQTLKLLINFFQLFYFSAFPCNFKKYLLSLWLVSCKHCSCRASFWFKLYFHFKFYVSETHDWLVEFSSCIGIIKLWGFFIKFSFLCFVFFARPITRCALFRGLSYYEVGIKLYGSEIREPCK